MFESLKQTTIFETEDHAPIECTIQWLNMYDKDLKKRITERVAKKEEEKDEDMHAESDQVQPEEPKVPPPEKVSIEIQIQTDDSFLSDQKSGSSAKEEAPAPSGNSQKGEEPEEKKDDIQKVDTAPKKRTCHTCLSWSRYHWI